MKIDDGALNRYLIKNLQPLTEADPSLLANYVAALLKNNKPKKDLQKLCIDQLYDFLGDGTKTFVAKLFQSLEDGTVPQPAEEMESGKAIESGSAITGGAEVVELRTSPPRLERLPSTALRSFGEGEDDSSDDEDDDRNHKHRRRVSRSRSFDRDGEDEVDRGLYRKRGRGIDNGQILRENERQGNERRVAGHTLYNERDGLGKFDRRLGRDHGPGRFSADGGQRGIGRSGPQFRDAPGPRFDGPNGMMRGNIGRGRGIGLAWVPHDQRFPPPSFPDGPDFAPPLLPPGPGTGFFPGRGIPGRGTPHSPWAGFGPLPGLGNGPLEHSHPLSGGIGGGRGPPPLSAGMGMNMNINMGRPRCLDFEERGYCLRGDLCPMEHGANRIVVEDVQSLSKFNLPVSLPSGRTLGGGSGPSSGPMLPPGLGLANRTNHGSRETSLPAMGEENALLNGVIPGNGGAEPDSYDPDQPLWNKDRSEASSDLRTLSSFKKRSQDQEWEGDAVDNREKREGSEGTETGSGRLVRLGGSSNGGSQLTEGGPTVWDRIGPVIPVGIRLDGGLRSSAPVDLLHGGKQLRKDAGDEAVARPRVPWQGKWNREVESEEESALRGASSIPATQSRGRGAGQGDAGAGQRSGEGTSYGSRGTGGRGGSGFGTERAQRTLYVSFIPPNSNRTEHLLIHFQKFGEVLDIRIPAHSDRAFVQFSRREDAEAALTAPDAVIGNRFIRLSWANRDSIPDPSDTTSLKPASRAAMTPGISTGPTVHTAKASEQAGMNGRGNAPADPPPMDAPGKTLAPNGLTSTIPSAGVGVVVKKQDELAKMREEIRKKQEALAQKRNDFRRKLEELGKQGGDNSETEQPSKRQRLEDAEENSSAPRKIVSQSTPSVSASAVPTEPSLSTAALARTNSGEAPNKQTVPSVAVQPPQPSPRTGRMPHARINSANIAYVSPMTRGPARFKLDNRTTVFRVLPPFPVSVMDVGVLKDHFVMFGELATVEVDDAKGSKLEGSTKLNETTSVRVRFATRRAAERAFAQGRWLQGQNLQLVWVDSPSTPTSAVARAETVGEKPSLTTQKIISGLPSNTEQEGINGSRSIDEVVTGPVHEVLVADGNTLEEEGVIMGGSEKKPSSTAQNLEWRRDTALQLQAVSNTGRGNVAPGPTTESPVDSPLVSESAGITNLSS